MQMSGDGRKLNTKYKYTIEYKKLSIRKGSLTNADEVNETGKNMPQQQCNIRLWLTTEFH